jgi:Domain of unknown function (DUF4349)
MRKRVARTVGMIVLATLGVSGAALVAGCSGSGSNSGSSSTGGRAGAAQLPNGSGSYGANNSNGSSGSNGSSTSSGKTANVADTSNLIILAGLQLGVKDPEQAAGAAEQLVISVGGYVAAAAEGVGEQVLPSANTSADTTESSETGVSPLALPVPSAAANADQALLLLRVPPSKLDSVLAALAGSGSVSYRTQSETDVTAQVADVNSRIASAQASLAELRGMIDKAASMNDLISLEQALASRESDLESLEAQQRALSDQTSFATVTVGYFVPAAAAKQAPPAARHNAFVTALDDGWHALVATFRVILVVLGWLLPFAVVVAVLWWPVRRLARRTWWRPRAQDPTE